MRQVSAGRRSSPGNAEILEEAQCRRITVREAGEGRGVGGQIRCIEVQVEEPEDEEPEDADGGTDPESAVDAAQCSVRAVVGTCLDGVRADDGTEHADTADEEREDNAFVSEGRHAKDHGCDDRDLVGFEDVRCHTGTVTDVVTDVVGDRCRIARIIFRNILFDLPHEVGPDIRRLRVDTAAHAHEEGDAAFHRIRSRAVLHTPTHRRSGRSSCRPGGRGRP